MAAPVSQHGLDQKLKKRMSLFTRRRIAKGDSQQDHASYNNPATSRMEPLRYQSTFEGQSQWPQSPQSPSWAGQYRAASSSSPSSPPAATASPPLPSAAAVVGAAQTLPKARQARKEISSRIRPQRSCSDKSSYPSRHNNLESAEGVNGSVLPALALDDYAALRIHAANHSESLDGYQHGTSPHSPSHARNHAFSRPRSGSAPVGHNRVRSHFSIPDVMVTGVEEEGEEVHFELRLPADKRRTHLFYPPEQTDSAPIESELAIYSSQRSPPILGEPFDLEATRKQNHQGGSSGTRTVSNDAAAYSSSQRSPKLTTKRTRKSSFPLLFGRRGSKDEDKEASEASPRHVYPVTITDQSVSPYGRAAFASSGSLPSASSKDSLPSPSSSAPRTPPADLTSPPDTPSSSKDCYISRDAGMVHPTSRTPFDPAQTTGTRKKLNQEEQALMRDLERVDEMVRSHDAMMRQQRIESSRGSNLSMSADATLNQKKPKRKLPNALKRMTIFSVGSKTTTGSNMSRRNSTQTKKAGTEGSSASPAARPAPTREASVRRKEPPHIIVTSPESSPVRPNRPPSLYASRREAADIQTAHSPTAESIASSRPEIGRKPVIESKTAAQPVQPAASSKRSDESERASFTPQEWSDLAHSESRHGYAALTSLTDQSTHGSLLEVDHESTPSNHPEALQHNGSDTAGSDALSGQGACRGEREAAAAALHRIRKRNSVRRRSGIGQSGSRRDSGVRELSKRTGPQPSGNAVSTGQAFDNRPSVAAPTLWQYQQGTRDPPQGGDGDDWEDESAHAIASSASGSIDRTHSRRGSSSPSSDGRATPRPLQSSPSAVVVASGGDETPRPHAYFTGATQRQSVESTYESVSGPSKTTGASPTLPLLNLSADPLVSFVGESIDEGFHTPSPQSLSFMPGQIIPGSKVTTVFPKLARALEAEHSQHQQQLQQQQQKESKSATGCVASPSDLSSRPSQHRRGGDKASKGSHRNETRGGNILPSSTQSPSSSSDWSSPSSSISSSTSGRGTSSATSSTSTSAIDLASLPAVAKVAKQRRPSQPLVPTTPIKAAFMTPMDI